MAQRSFGWIQDAGEIFKLRNIVEIFVVGSPTHKMLLEDKIPNYVSQFHGRDEFIFDLTHEPIEISYAHLKGKGAIDGTTRATAPCSGIAQAVMDSQNGRPYVSDWAIEAYLRLAVSVGFLKYHRENDMVTLTDLGKELAESEKGSPQEKEILSRAILSYPPATRVLTILEQNPSGLTKYGIGQHLGFIGENGFSSFPEEMILEALAMGTPQERKKIRSDVEGTSDKYARMIAGWLSKLGWVRQNKVKKSFTLASGQTHEENVNVFYLTLAGKQALNKSRGLSKHNRIPKIVMYEMLGTRAIDLETVRRRRAVLLDALTKGKQTVDSILDRFEGEFVFASESLIEDDIKGLINIGLNIRKQGDYYVLEDEIIELTIPSAKPIAEKEFSFEDLKDTIRQHLRAINHKYLSLIDYSFDPDSYLSFEIATIELLHDELGFNAIHLGFSNKPDGVLSVLQHGVIIDNKAYSKGFTLPANMRREMKDYIQQNQIRDPSLHPNRWWENFADGVNEFSYLFVSSLFKGDFLGSMATLKGETSTSGAVITAENLLYLADLIKESKIDESQFIALLTSDKEIIPSDFSGATA